MPKPPAMIICSINGIGRRPYVPVTPGEVADDALACLDAGAAIIHSHIDLSATTGAEAAARYLEGWSPVIRQRPGALFYPTANFGPDGINYDHLAPLAACSDVRMGLCDIGPLQLGRLEDGVPTGSRLIPNTYDEVAARFETCRANGLGVAIQAFDPSGVRVMVHWWRAGRLPPGALLNLYFYPEPSGPPPWRGHYSLPPTPTALAAYLEILGDCPVPWAASVIGGDMLDGGFGEAVARAGGHLNVGLEPFRGGRTPTNVDLVKEAAAICAAIGRPVATSAQAAKILGLPPRTVQGCAVQAVGAHPSN